MKLLIFYYVKYCVVVELSDDEASKCLSMMADGREYIGDVGETLSGRTCQLWDSQSPHEHFYTEIDMFPDYAKNPKKKIADVSNYCRNPSVGSLLKPLPWCYTNRTDVTWEFCNIPRCKGK